VFYSFPALSCEFASVDVSDVLGTVSLNLCVPCYFFYLLKYVSMSIYSFLFFERNLEGNMKAILFVPEKKGKKWHQSTDIH
jgi:hypothetical protein